jgi:hypothetical protein
MSDIKNAVEQDKIADSLLGNEGEQQTQPEAEASEYAASGTDLLDEAITEQAAERLQFDEGDSGVERWQAEHPEEESQQEQVRQEQSPGLEAEEQEQHVPTPEEVQAGVEQLDNAVKEYGLNEPADARTFADDFTGAFGSDVFKASVDIESLGGVMSKTAFSALNIYAATGGDLSKMPAIPEQNAQVFAHDFLKGMGLDPRSMPNVDASLLARTTLGGMMNFLRTYDSYGGRVTDLSKLNDPKQAEFYLQNFMQALGVPGSANRETAVKFADACAKQLLRVMGKVSEVNRQRQEAQANQRQPRARGQRIPASIRAGIKGTKPPTKFQTNSGPNEPFDAQTMAAYYERTARL